jgi:hypothetical protein
MDETAHAELLVLEKAWSGGFSIQSQFFRDYAVYVGLCASEGYITTLTGPRSFGKIWRLTPEGSQRLYEARLINTLKETPDEPE